MRHLLATLTSLFIGAVASAGPIAAVEISSVTVDREHVKISGQLGRSWSFGQPTLRELRPHETSASLPPHAVALGANGGFSITLPRHAGDRDRIYSRWQIFGTDLSDKRGGMSPPIWATDIAKAAAYPDLEPMVAKTRKGVGGIHPDPRLFPDLVELGVGHITVNIPMAPNFSKGRIAQLDRLLTFAHGHGIVVTAILLTPPRGSILTHPDCAPSAKYSLPNLTSREGADAFARSVQTLAERYTKPGAPHGRITHWIVGNEVDAGWVWTNAGEKSAEEYMRDYNRALRVTYYAVRSFDPSGKVFISLTHSWNKPHQPNPKRFYKSRDLLRILKDHSKHCGDFEWGVAYHPYAENLFNPKTWEDQQVDDSYDTPLITMKNIGVLDRLMHTPALLYRGEKVRTVLLSEQGYHSKDNSAEAQRLQAAAIVYAWRQMAGLKSIEAFHYHRWIDHEREGGLKLGLWTVKKGSITWPDRKKQSWSVYRALGTPDEDGATQFADEVLDPG